MVGKFVYWLAVLAISLALVVALMLFFESRDDSSLEGAAVPAPVAQTASLRIGPSPLLALKGV